MTDGRAILEVVEPGLLTTVQDLGRPDAVALGVPVGGACDSWSLRVANVLAGNDPNAAALEITLAGPTFRVTDDCRVGLAGADFEARVNGEPFEPGSGRVLRRGESLAFGAAQSGVRAYLAIHGGVDVPNVLGSASTCLVGGFGGLEGRPVRSGDIIRSRSSAPVDARIWRWPATESTHRPLRVLDGPHPSAFEELLATDWTVSARGDRQGIRLDGPPRFPDAAAAAELLSQGVVWGAIQVPPDGQPICLLADRQTVGGYPVVAVVISADLALLGQLCPAEPVHFAAVSPQEAVHALRDQEALFNSSRSRVAIT
jgi:biotin-dependent carboxylase-like uncharacterized protein